MQSWIGLWRVQYVIISNKKLARITKQQPREHLPPWISFNRKIILWEKSPTQPKDSSAVAVYDCWHRNRISKKLAIFVSFAPVGSERVL